MSANSPAPQTALVTGAGQGVGFGIARALGQAGYRVVVTDALTASAVRATTELIDEGVDAMALELSVENAHAWSFALHEVANRWGDLDVLVNNAGISPRGDFVTTDEALWDRTMAINLKGPFLGIRAAWPMLCRRKGAVINIGSTRSTRPMRGMVPYGTSKAALWGLTRQTAVEGFAHGVSCNLIAPGWVDTPGERIIQARQGRPEFPEGLMNMTTVEEIGAAAVFLVSESGRRINGVTLYVDSGLHIADDAGMVYLPPDDLRRYR